MQPCLHSVSYAGLWGQASLSLSEFLGKAHALGFPAVMLMAKRPHLSVLDYDQEACRNLRRQVERLQLRVAVLAGYTDFGVGADRPDVPHAELQIAHVREMCKAASELDCGLVRVFTSYDHAGLDKIWPRVVVSLRECARIAARYNVTIGVQNHHDLAVDVDSMIDLLDEIGEPNCRAMFDPWAPALQGQDIVQAAKRMAPYMVHTTVADYVRRLRFRYEPALVNYVPETSAVRAVPMGEGFIDYASFFSALREAGYRGHVAYEMCSPLRGGGTVENLDRCARQFLSYLAK